jgi:Clp amino terminal domain, pathogenicity island component
LRSHEAVESLRRQVEEQTVIREKVSTSVDLPLSHECKRILAYASEEADKVSHKFVGTEHLFLGVLREHDCFAAKLLGERGIALEMAREQIGSNPTEQLLGRSPKSPGLPSGYISHKLLYNNAAEMLILELRSSSVFVLPTRLFTRHIGKEAYEQVGSPSEDVSYESPVTCGSFPVVVFNSLKRKKTSGDWEGVYSFNLNTRELAVCVSPEKLRLSEVHGRHWIPQLVSLSEEARTLHVNIGVEKIVSGGGIVHYYLAKVDLPDQQVTLLSRLLDTRF